MSSGKKLYKTKDILNLRGLVSVSSFSCKKVYIRMQDAVLLGREYLCGYSRNCLLFAKMQAKLTGQFKRSPWHRSQSCTHSQLQARVFWRVKKTTETSVPGVSDPGCNIQFGQEPHGNHQASQLLHLFSLLKEHLYMLVQWLLFWRYDHKWCPSPRPPHQHLSIVGVRPSECIGGNWLLVVEDVWLLLVGSAHQRRSRAQRHIWIHVDVDPHPPPDSLQHNALLEEEERMLFNPAMMRKRHNLS